MLKRILIYTMVVFLFVVISGCDFGGESQPEIVGQSHKPYIKLSADESIIKPRDRKTYGKGPNGWIPSAKLEDKSRWKGIVIHHSAASYGDALHEDKVHRSRGFDSLGYHFVINNGLRKRGYGKADGLVQVGERWLKQLTGAHCRENGDSSNYYNEHTIGICLIGDFEKTRPTQQQMRSLSKLVRFLKSRYRIPSRQIKGHGDIKPTKCPGKNFSISQFK